jgi:hypothetical protein
MWTFLSLLTGLYGLYVAIFGPTYITTVQPCSTNVAHVFMRPKQVSAGNPFELVVAVQIQQNITSHWTVEYKHHVRNDLNPNWPSNETYSLCDTVIDLVDPNVSHGKSSLDFRPTYTGSPCIRMRPGSYVLYSNHYWPHIQGPFVSEMHWRDETGDSKLCLQLQQQMFLRGRSDEL